MDVEAFLQAIDREAENAYGSETDSQLSGERARAIDQYLGKNTIPAPDGRSQVVDRSVFETIQWILPSLIDIFANGDDVVNLPPIGREDEQAAKQETQYLNHIALNKTPWLETCLTWFLDAMLTKNAYAYIYKEYKIKTELEEYERQTTDGLTVLLQDPDVQVIEQNSYPSDDGEMEPVIDPQTGQPAMQIVGVNPQTGQPIPQPMMQPKMLHDVTLRRREEHGKYCIDVLPPERCLVSVNTPSFRVLENCPYFEYYDYKPISDLRASGFDVDDDIEDQGDDFDSNEDQSRNTFNEDNLQGDRPADPSMRKVKVRTIWIQYDYDGDGIAELNRVVRVGREILERKEVGRVHVASIVPLPFPHRHMGLSVADIVKDLQDIKTIILRGGLDNLYLSNNPLKFANDKINLDDLQISRPGGIVRGGPGSVYGQDIAPIAIPFVFPQAMEGLQYIDQIRQNRVGVNEVFQGIDKNALNQTATGIQQLSTMAAQRVKLIARIFASGFRDLFDILHEIVLKGGHQKEVVQIRGQWVEVDPATWKKRNDFSIQVGYAAGNKDAMVNRLMLINKMQMDSRAQGIRIATDENMYQTAVELTKASDFTAPERFWTDPAQLPPAQPQPDPLIVSTKLKADSDEKIKGAQLQSDERVKGAELQKEESANVDKLAIEKYKVDKQAETQLTLARMSAGHDVNMEHYKAVLNPKPTPDKGDGVKDERVDSHDKQLSAIAQMLEYIAQSLEDMHAPTEVIRDKAGKPTHIKKGKAMRELVRGEDGKVSGTSETKY